MLNAFLWGLLATSSLVLGGIIASRINLSRRALGIIMAFGAGTLISAVSYELVFEAVQLARGTGFPALGLFAGAFTYYLCEWIIEKVGGRHHKVAGASKNASLVIPMILAIILDGIPESIVIGLGISEGGAVSLAMLAAVFVSNLPEAIAGTTGMKAGGWKSRNIILLWLSIAVICAFASLAGYSLFANASAEWLSFIQAFAAGAILIVLTNSMIPESYEHAKKFAGIFTVLGFSFSILIIIMERVR